MRRRSSLLLFFVTLVVIVLLVTLGPKEQVLGANVRLVYLHGAWVWTALIGFAVSAGIGILGLVLRRERLQRISIALGLVALFFWITYLPMSIWTMQANWGGLFLEEPRWRMALDFAIAGILMQIAIWIIKNPGIGAGLNALYFVILAWRLTQTEQVMHPPSPILTSESLIIRGFFFLLLGCCLLAGTFLAHWLDKKVNSG